MAETFKILSVGEVLWDMLPSGKKVGGAPANFAYHCLRQGADVRLVSRIGDDELGNEILDFFDRIGLSAELVGRDVAAPTGTVDVHLGADGQARYTINEHVAWDFLEATPAALQWATQADAIGFGSLAMRSETNRRTLQTLLDATKPNTLKVLDLNLRDPFCEPDELEFVLSRADVFKLNDEELIRVADLFELQGTMIEDRLTAILDRFGFRLVILTLGADGSWLATESERVHTPGNRVTVVDTVGAGDAFTAAAVTGFLLAKPLEEIGRQAGELGAYVCTQNGGTPTIPENLVWTD